jgi:hypothetical protein
MGKNGRLKNSKRTYDHSIKYLIKFKKGGMTDVAIPESLRINIQKKSIAQSTEGE